ncbi:MAG: Lrp/AsnC family transcriptional regulator [Pseudomonadota bacterium]
MVNLSKLEKHLLNEYQREMPISATPYADMAEQLQQLGIKTTEQQVINCLADLQKRGLISRVGAVLKPQKVGASTLAAVAAPEHRIDEVAQIISSFSQVNHNYLREHNFNIWFVVTAETNEQVLQVLNDIEEKTALSVLNLPMEEDFHIDLGFPLWC